MIRSYRTKRRRVEQELRLLNFIPSNDILIHKMPASVQPALNIPAPSSSPKYHGNGISNNVDNEFVSYDVNNDFEEEILNEQHFTTRVIKSTHHFENCCSNKIELSLRSLLSSWVVDYNVPHTTVNALLRNLKSHQCIQCLKSLSLDTRTLLNSSSSKVTSIRTVGLGKYYHFGLGVGIRRLSLNLEFGKVIKVVIGVDVLPLSKSTSSQFWPILAYIQPYVQHVFLVGLYHGQEKPYNSNDYLKDFIEETKNLVNNGVEITNNLIKKVVIHTFCTDAPSKSFILNTKGHAGFYSCTRCTEDGKYINNRMCFPF